jgi:hypothetical protein
MGRRQGETYRRVGVWACAKSYQLRGDFLVNIAMSKSSFIPQTPLRRHADTPTRFPSRRPILNATTSSLYARRCTSVLTTIVSMSNESGSQTYEDRAWQYFLQLQPSITDVNAAAELAFRAVDAFERQLKRRTERDD